MGGTWIGAGGLRTGWVRGSELGACGGTRIGAGGGADGWNADVPIWGTRGPDGWHAGWEGDGRQDARRGTRIGVGVRGLDVPDTKSARPDDTMLATAVAMAIF